MGGEGGNGIGGRTTGKIKVVGKGRAILRPSGVDKLVRLSREREGSLQSYKKNKMPIMPFGSWSGMGVAAPPNRSVNRGISIL